jgi:hypothetical protein
VVADSGACGGGGALEGVVQSTPTTPERSSEGKGTGGMTKEPDPCGKGTDGLTAEPTPQGQIQLLRHSPTSAQDPP